MAEHYSRDLLVLDLANALAPLLWAQGWDGMSIEAKRYSVQVTEGIVKEMLMPFVDVAAAQGVFADS